MRKIVIFGLLVLFFVTPIVAREELGLQIGTQAPDFEALTHQGNPARLSDINKEGPVVLVFYRGG